MARQRAGAGASLLAVRDPRAARWLDRLRLDRELPARGLANGPQSQSKLPPRDRRVDARRGTPLSARAHPVAPGAPCRLREGRAGEPRAHQGDLPSLHEGSRDFSRESNNGRLIAASLLTIVRSRSGETSPATLPEVLNSRQQSCLGRTQK